MTMPQEADQVRPHLPSQDELAALGEISVRHGYLDFVLRRTIRDLAEITTLEADKALSRTGSAEMRDLVERHAKRRLGKGHPYVLRLKATLRDCQDVTEQRNRLVHDPWVRWYEGDGTPGRYRDGETLKLPALSELKALAERISLLASHLDRERLEGGLAIALMDIYEEALAAKQRSK